MVDYSLHLIGDSEIIVEAFKKLNNVPFNLTLFVVNNENKLVGTLTDGDIRRGFLKGLQLSDRVQQFMVKNFKSLTQTELNPQRIKEIKEKGIRLIPIVDKEQKILEVIDLNKIETVLPLDVVLMAGGRGERLRPLTDTVPKPLLIVGNKPIIDHNIDHLIHFGITNYYITIRYLGEQIEAHLGTGESKNIHISYIKEKKSLGTIGALSNFGNYKNDVVLLMNADLFTNIDLEEFYNEFLSSKADMAVATIPYVVDIPYAVLDIEEDNIRGFKEKPTITYYSNAGIYLIKRELISLIPKDEFFNATDFIQTLIDTNKKVVRFPILGYWYDIGKMEDFIKVQELAKYLKEK